MAAYCAAMPLSLADIKEGSDIVRSLPSPNRLQSSVRPRSNIENWARWIYSYHIFSFIR